MGFLSRLWPRTDTDEALVAAIAQGDESAFAQLIARHGPRVLALARRLCSAADAEDIVQEVFIRVWQEAVRWQPGKAAYSTWLYRVTLNLSLNQQQRVQARFEPLAAYESDLLCPQPNAEQRLDQEQSVNALQQALERLPQAQQIAAQLRYSTELPVAEIAQIMGLSRKAVESLLVRARQGLRQHLS